ncbi:MAG: hypothetical protein V3R93_06520, partial [Candidatus Hydrothermarchaeaceae archaeon]
MTTRDQDDWENWDFSSVDEAPAPTASPAGDASQDWDNWDFSSGPEESAPLPETTPTPVEPAPPKSGMGKKIWERLRHSEGGLMRDLAVLGREFDKENKFFDELERWGESLQEHAADQISSEEMKGIEEELSKEFFEPIDPDKPEWDFRKPLDFSNIKRGEGGLATAGWLGVETAIPTIISIYAGRLTGGVAMRAISKLGSVKNLAKIATTGRAAKLLKGSKEAIRAGKKAERILNLIEGVVAGTVYGASEGTLGAAAAGRGWNEQVDQEGFSDLLADNPFGQKIYDAAIEEGMAQGEAETYTRESIKDAGRRPLMKRTFVTTSLGGAPAGMLMKRIIVRTPFSKPFAKGKLRGVVKGALAEGVVEEGPQSAFETYWNNVATKEYMDETVDTSMGIFSAAVKGTVGGAMIGGPIGGIAAPTKARAKKIETAKEKAKDRKKNVLMTMKLEAHARQA